MLTLHLTPNHVPFSHIHPAPSLGQAPEGASKALSGEGIWGAGIGISLAAWWLRDTGRGSPASDTHYLLMSHQEKAGPQGHPPCPGGLETAITEANSSSERCPGGGTRKWA